MSPKLRLNLTQADDSTAAERVQAATKRKQAASETMDEAWARILAMKNSDTDQARLIAVKNAMTEGTISRSPSDAGKRFSKAEALRLYAQLAEQQRDQKLADLVAKTPANYVLVDTLDKLTKMADDIKAAEVIAFDCETFGENNGALDPWRGNVAGFSVSTRQASYYVPLNHTEKCELNSCSTNDVLGIVAVPLMTSKIVMHNAPFDCKWFEVKFGLNLADALHADTRIMAMALDENRDHRLKNLLTDWLKQPSDNFDELFPNVQFNNVPLEVALPYAAGDTEKTLALYDWIMTHLNSPQLANIKRLLFEVEMPVCRHFIKSDLRGIRFDREAAAKLDEKLAIEEAELQRKIIEQFGEEINLNSPAQLSKKLFVDLKLTDHGKGSTNSRFMKKIKREHPVVPMILEYKEIGKLRSAFTQKLPKEVKSDGKIHPWHNTWGAATGRFTCKDPNTQQIPAKRPEIRHLFLATDADRILVSIDYSQIELRVLAHMANETILIEAFEQGRDIHSTTAALISGYTYEEIEANKDTDGSPYQKFRKQAKIVNFGIVYGMGAGKLADTLEISKNEAQKIIDDYFKGYPGIKRYMDDQHATVMKQGFVTDIFGRKRRLHADVKSKERFRVFGAQRQAGNFPIQASAGSILKKAIVDLADVLPQMDVYILSQTHDEVLYDCPRNISRENLYKIREVMAQAVKLRVPVSCDIEIYPERWQQKISEEEWFSAF
ncbi:DNA polymerase [Cytobacillus gottheilii]|uniref:DNA polymerase I n=1 Tax=Cytobacillus gottheilii TaxID=859144 RepID=A0ABX8FG17_9BACI|nr:DNA polymerase [Cytobacillus gottheilii]QVY62956.1 DNA-directed DNA polymerase [Cytobacillus gottheilii]